MKTPSLILSTSLLLLTACDHRSDAEVRSNLPGTWHSSVISSTTDNGSQSTITVGPNFDFTSQAISSNGILNVELAGSFRVEDGVLTMTVTKSSHTNEPVPFSIPAKIIEADASKMVVLVSGAGGATNKIVMQKVTK